MSKDIYELFQYVKQDAEPIVKQECKHLNCDISMNHKVCLDCGHEFKDDIKYDKEWRFYGSNDTRHTTDPNRCHMRKSADKNILKDVSGLGFSDRIIDIANSIYTQVTDGNIYRGSTRRAIIFACVFHSYKLDNNPQSCDHLIKTFNLTKKNGLKGLKFVHLYSAKEKNINRSYITVENIITEIMNKFNAGSEDIRKIINIYHKIKNKSQLINRARPQSVAAGIIRYYCIQNGKDIDGEKFRSVVNLSELTINRICKEIENILN
jgi:transcription initiation factor TFIIIB Brf1 subunit/transcription initiation factor TFIIB